MEQPAGSTGERSRKHSSGAKAGRQVVAPDGREGTPRSGAKAGERKTWREAGDEEMGWSELNEESQERETRPFSWASHISQGKQFLSA